MWVALGLSGLSYGEDHHVDALGLAGMHPERPMLCSCVEYFVVQFILYFINHWKPPRKPLIASTLPIVIGPKNFNVNDFVGLRFSLFYLFLSRARTDSRTQRGLGGCSVDWRFPVRYAAQARRNAGQPSLCHVGVLARLQVVEIVGILVEPLKVFETVAVKVGVGSSCLAPCVG